MTLGLFMKAGAWEQALTLLSEMYLSCKTSKIFFAGSCSVKFALRPLDVFAQVQAALTTKHYLLQQRRLSVRAQWKMGCSFAAALRDAGRGADLR